MIIKENLPKSGIKNGNVTHWHLGSLAATGKREESASHHVLITWSHISFNTVRQHANDVRELTFRMRRRHLEVKFHDDLNCPRSFQMHSKCILVIPNDP